jgi:hypothetical protein
MRPISASILLFLLSLPGGQYTPSGISLEMVSFGAHVVNTFENIYMAILKRYFAWCLLCLVVLFFLVECYCGCGCQGVRERYIIVALIYAVRRQGPGDAATCPLNKATQWNLSATCILKVRATWLFLGHGYRVVPLHSIVNASRESGGVQSHQRKGQ